MDEIIATLRGLIQHGILHRVEDGGGVQVVDVETAEGVLRGSVQVLQTPGFASNPGTDGVTALVLAPGGDQGIPVVIITATGVGLGKLGTGEAALYALDGSARVHVKPGGEVHVLAATKIVADCAEAEVTATGKIRATCAQAEVTASTKATITAPQIELHGTVNVVGTLKVNGITLAVP
ncbi:phage baseplate assembly protein [Roseomonas sp. HJA6]|uniref:Phage baseplate assembly protein n=1 Tax=Roseomonas alba TaxID=2846776 RepID=A0ABS7AI74_9PROT|nr:phage baseplate assembly protein [Neoroseomonas alba]MBW6402027.1 phage baseplate assembly protein [Neoroseomonas alba]